MWETIGGVVTIVSALVGYFVLRNKNNTDAVNSAKDYARAKSKKNEAADDRADIEAQKIRIEEQKKEEEQKTNGTN